MSEEPVSVLAHIKAMPGKEEIVKAELLSLIPPTRSEPGCVAYDLHRSAEDPAVFLLYERWSRREALDQHLKMPYLKEFRAKAEEILEEPVQITLWEPLG